MKVSELRQAVLKFFGSEEFGNHLPMLFHNGRKVFFKALFPSGSSNEIEESLIDQVFIDGKKKRLFYVGKEEGLRRGLLFRKNPMSIKLEDIFKWSKKPSKYDEYEVYFAWNYESKDRVLYNYTPLTSKIDADPNYPNIECVVLQAEEDFKSFKLKAKNLHEKALRPTSKRRHGNS